MLDRLLHRKPKNTADPTTIGKAPSLGRISGIFEPAGESDEHTAANRDEFANRPVKIDAPESKVIISRRHPEWQLRLPFDVALIIVPYLLDDCRALSNLTLACCSLAQICRPLRFRTTTLRGWEKRPVTSTQRFVLCLNTSPDILEMIENLQIISPTKFLKIPEGPVNFEDESLCFILQRPYSKLRRMELSFTFAWAAMPSRLQRAFYAAFLLSSLQEVVLCQARFHANTLAHLHSISSLDIRGDISLLPWTPSDCGDNLCRPTHLAFQDATQTGITTKNLFNERSPLKLMRLEKMEAYTASANTLHMNPVFSMCASTLTTLHLYMGSSRWRSSPEPVPLNLSPLTRLQDLLLTFELVQVTVGLLGTNSLVDESYPALAWAATSLSSLGPRPHPVRDISQITLFILHRRLRYESSSTKVPWGTLDAVFGPTLGRRWPKLQSVAVRHVMENASEDEKQFMPSKIESVMRPMMPVLHSAGVLKICASTFGKHGSVDGLLFTVGSPLKFSLTKGFAIDPANLITQSLFNVLCMMPTPSPNHASSPSPQRVSYAPPQTPSQARACFASQGQSRRRTTRDASRRVVVDVGELGDGIMGAKGDGWRKEAPPALGGLKRDFAHPAAPGVLDRL